MANQQDDREENSVPYLAVQALDVAQRNAFESGLPLVLVRGNQLIETTPHGAIVLKDLPARKKVAIRTKFLKP